MMLKDMALQNAPALLTGAFLFGVLLRYVAPDWVLPIFAKVDKAADTADDLVDHPLVELGDDVTDQLMKGAGREENG